MKITIDTNEDSKEDIQKAIDLLKRIVGESKDEGFEPEVSQGAFDLFDNDDDDFSEQKKEDRPPKVEIIDY